MGVADNVYDAISMIVFHSLNPTLNTAGENPKTKNGKERRPLMEGVNVRWRYYKNICSIIGERDQSLSTSDKSESDSSEDGPTAETAETPFCCQIRLFVVVVNVARGNNDVVEAAQSESVAPVTDGTAVVDPELMALFSA